MVVASRQSETIVGPRAIRSVARVVSSRMRTETIRSSGKVTEAEVGSTHPVSKMVGKEGGILRVNEDRRRAAQAGIKEEAKRRSQSLKKSGMLSRKSWKRMKRRSRLQWVPV